MVSFDIEAAFPTLSHEYLWQVLKAYQVPLRIIKMLKGLYHDHRVTLRLLGAGV